MSALRILVVDDNADCAQSLARLLRVMGHEAWTADGGEAALLEAERYHPQLILVDIGMPHLDGYQVVQQLRTNSKANGATIVALTGLATEEDQGRAATAGFDGHFAKPIGMATLEKLLSDIAAKWRLESATAPPRKVPPLVRQEGDRTRRGRPGNIRTTGLPGSLDPAS